MMCIYSLLTLGLNFHYGFTGLINFGHVAFFCIGAYTSALLTTSLGVPFIVGLISAAIVAAIFGIIFSLPTAKLGVHYWAIVTLGAAEIIRLFVMNERWLTGGSLGIIRIPRPFSFIPSSFYPLFYLCLAGGILIIIFFLLERIVNSPMGRILKSMREGGDLPLAFGKNIYRYKIISMMLGAGIAGIAGSLYAHFTTYISPFDFMPLITFMIWTMIIVGGKGNNLGAIVGAGTIMTFLIGSRFVDDYLPIGAVALGQIRMMAIGVLLILVLMFKSEGLIKEKKVTYEVDKNATSS